LTFVVDTNIVAELLKDDPSVCRRVASLPRNEVLLPQPVVAEVEFGLARLGRSKRRERLRHRFEILLGELHRAHWTDAVGVAFGGIKAALQRSGLMIEDFDVAIAAHARALSATLATRNVRHFERIAGLRVERW
jgi:tRNA(fMet)-specific endonuclease VapC